MFLSIFFSCNVFVNFLFSKGEQKHDTKATKTEQKDDKEQNVKKKWTKTRQICWVLETSQQPKSQMKEKNFVFKV